MGRDCICFLGLGYCDHGDELGRPMTDLISREAAIALLDAEKVNAAETGCATDEAYNLAIGHCIEALTNMPIAEIGLPYVKFDADLLATLRDCKSAVVTIQEKP